MLAPLVCPSDRLGIAVRVLAHSAALLAIVAGLTVGGMVVTVSPAAADTGGVFNPANYGLNYDPTVLKATINDTALNGVMTEGQLAGTLLNKVRYSPGWTAITSRLGFGASGILADGTAAAQAASMERAYAPVATKFGPVVKVLGSVAEGAMVAQAGFSLGAGIDRMAGVDVTGGLCAGSVGPFSVVNQILATASDTNCAEYKMGEELKAALNNDSPPAGVTFAIGGVSCSSTGCATLTGASSYHDPGQGIYYCVRVSSGYLSYSPMNVTSTGSQMGSASYTSGGVGALSCGYPDSDQASFVQTASGPTQMSGWRASMGADLVAAIPGVVADPARTLRCDVTLSSGSVLSNSTAVFHESDRTVPPYVCPAIPPEAIPTKGTVWETGGSSGDVKWQELNVSTEYQADRSAHPDCTLGQCRLDLTRVSDSLKCLDNGATCDGWFTDPTKTTDYKCTLGPYDLPLDHCNAMSNTFNAQSVSTGHAYSDPTTGTDAGQTTTLPAGDPAPGTDPQTGQCYPTGWGVFNPVEWVLKPVSCALQWAFVPPPSVVTGLETTVSESWKASTPGKLEQEISAELPEFKSADSGCSGVLINFPMWSSSGTYSTSAQHVLAACPGDYFANWAPLFSFFIGGSFTIVGILGAKRLVSALFGFHDPGIGG